jgi:hypothetical protein
MISPFIGKDCLVHLSSDPGWVAVLRMYNLHPLHMHVPFDDDSLEWERASYNLHLFGPEGKAGDKIMPLGFMLNKLMTRLAEEFLAVTKKNIHEPCVWFRDRPYLPVQYVAICGCFGYWSPFLWKAGVSSMQLVDYAHCIRDNQREAFVLHCRGREGSMIAVAWMCRQIYGTSWTDCTEPLVNRMRQVDN